MIYISKSVDDKLDEYATFLRYSASYTIDEAKARRWEIEYQIEQRCNPILMKPNTSGTLNFKSVLQKQEIARYYNNRDKLINLIRRRRGTRGNTQWKINYCVSNSGDIFIVSMEFYNMFSEVLNQEQLKQIISETIELYSMLLKDAMVRRIVSETIERFINNLVA